MWFGDGRCCSSEIGLFGDGFIAMSRAGHDMGRTNSRCNWWRISCMYKNSS